jgi:hypothetical protein
MAGNPIPKNDDALLALAEDVADGLHQLEAALGITGVTEAKVRADMTAARAAGTAARTAKEVRLAASTALQATDDAATAFLMAVRGVLQNFLGRKWSAGWETAGFPNQSTAVPATPEERLNLCAALNAYFLANPAREVAALNVTAVKAEEHHQALSDGRDLLDQKTTDQGQKLKARDAALLKLGQHLRTLVTDLESLLAEDDDRWHTFGLNAPADPVTPESVASLDLRLISATEILASWPRTPRATRYRPFVQIVGVDEDFVAREAVHGLDVVLKGFAAGQTVRVKIVAANDDGEANPGPTEEILVP